MHGKRKATILRYLHNSSKQSKSVRILSGNCKEKLKDKNKLHITSIKYTRCHPNKFMRIAEQGISHYLTEK